VAVEVSTGTDPYHWPVWLALDLGRQNDSTSGGPTQETILLFAPVYAGVWVNVKNKNKTNIFIYLLIPLFRLN